MEPKMVAYGIGKACCDDYVGGGGSVMEERRTMVEVDDVAELTRSAVAEDVRMRCERDIGSLVDLGRQPGISVEYAAHETRREQG